jgi:hypothetical protein
MKLDRRSFLGGAGFAAGAVVATSLVPLSVVHALPSETPLPSSVVPADDPSWIGHVDDACGHWPPYSHPIPYHIGRTSEVNITAAVIEPFDHVLMA